MSARAKTFAVISEGITDRVVIENILLGFFDGDEEEPALNPVELGDGRGIAGGQKPVGGWTLVLEALRDGKVGKALEVNDYVVIHIDTDVCEEKGFDVPRKDDGRDLEPKELVARVQQKLEGLIGSALCVANAERMLFAIAVNEIECWLLPLLYDDKKRAKTTGCLAAANQKLRERDERGLASASGEKFVDRYDGVSKPYRKRKKLLESSGKNPSLDVFVETLTRLEPSASD